MLRSFSVVRMLNCSPLRRMLVNIRQCQRLSARHSTAPDSSSRLCQPPSAKRAALHRVDPCSGVFHSASRLPSSDVGRRRCTLPLLPHGTHRCHCVRMIGGRFYAALRDRTAQ